ncbi:MAG: alginate lyase family protein [Dysgonamonadaceae bacterium]|nr:alginate lyase family protein [Dysgonamonadaceae bacterium]
MLYTQAQINFVASKIEARIEPWYSAGNNLIQVVNSYANRQHAATEDFHTPPFYGDSDENFDAKSGLTLDAHAAHANALAYALTGNETYAQKAIYFLNAWSTVNKTITENDSAGNATGTVLTASNLMPGVLIAADLLMGHDIWTTSDKAQFKTWIQQVMLPCANSIKGKSNNWGDWGVFAAASSYHLLGDKEKLLTEINRMKTRIDIHQDDDGSMPQETRRGVNGLWYTYFALTPITLSAQLAYNTTGQDLFNYTSENGKSIKKALDYLKYYHLHKSEWPWYPMTDSPTTKDAPSDLFEAMNNFYNREYESLVSPFRPVKGGYKGSRKSHTGWEFPTLMNTYPDASTSDKHSQIDGKTFVYPNPATNIVIVPGYNSPYLNVYDIAGRFIDLLPTVNPNVYDVSFLLSGLYFLHVNNKTIKLMKH